MRGLPGNLVKETIYSVFAPRYIAAIESIKNFVFLYLANVITEVVYRRSSQKKLHQNVKCGSLYRNIMPVQLEEVVNNTDSITTVTVLVKQREKYTVEEELKMSHQWQRNIPLHQTVFSQLAHAPHQTKNPEPDNFLLSRAIVRAGNIEIVRQSRVNWAENHTDRNYFLMRALL